MRIDAQPRPRRRLSMTSLIDVIFLLLLFFMLSSTFSRFAEIEVTGGVASAQGEWPDVLLRFDGTDWQVNGVAVADPKLGAELARLFEAGAESAVLLVRGAMTSQDLVEAVERIRSLTPLRLTIAR